jgi:hypothetical protein
MKNGFGSEAFLEKKQSALKVSINPLGTEIRIYWTKAFELIFLHRNLTSVRQYTILSVLCIRPFLCSVLLYCAMVVQNQTSGESEVLTIRKCTMQEAKNKRIFLISITWFIFNLERREYI